MERVEKDLVSVILDRVNNAEAAAGAVSKAAFSGIMDVLEVGACLEVLKDYLLATADIIDTNSIAAAGGKAG